MKLMIKKLSEDAIVPKQAHEGDAGIDLHTTEDHLLLPEERKMFATGLSFAFPSDYVGLVWDRSGMAAKKGIKTMAGVLDSNYRGELKIVLLNTSEQAIRISKGDRIAQLLIQPIIIPEMQEVDELPESVRGEGGFGSTGN